MRKVPEMIGQTLLKGVDLGILLMRFGGRNRLHGAVGIMMLFVH